MTARLNEIFSVIDSVEVFADIGCDHGYVAKAMLDGGKCFKAIVSDISPKCLKKATETLAEYIKAGRCESVVSDGFEKIGKCDLALIAGMGGEETVRILLNAKGLPEKLVLSPMHNPDKVRRTLIDLGYAIKRDYTFSDGSRFYDIIIAEKGEDFLTPEEEEFGRTNVKERGSAFKAKMEQRAKQLESYISSPAISEPEKERLTAERNRCLKYV